MWHVGSNFLRETAYRIPTMAHISILVLELGASYVPIAFTS
jgi:hypothetical protein